MPMLSRPLAVVLAAAAAAPACGLNATVYKMRPVMHYFRQWFDGATTAAYSHDPDVNPWTEAPTQEQLAEVLRRQGCAGEAFVTIDAEMGKDGIHRAVLRLNSGRLHFLASAGGRALVMDPPMRCSGPRVASLRRLGPAAGGLDAEPAEVLHPTDDPMVQDCMELFSRESVHQCGAKLVAEAVSANLEVVDGFEVRVHAKISRQGSLAEPAYHKINCLFEAPGAAPAQQQTRDISEATPEEKEGMAATVEMHVELCGASSVSPGVYHALRLFEMHGGAGELSHTKGYRHVYDHLPRWVSEVQMKSAANLPPKFDLRKGANSMCFPGLDGKSVVRSQGACGSCWAFAAASSFVANVCIAGKGNFTLDAYKRRLEVSVQRLISCNPQNYGCKGGHAQAAGASLAKHLPASEGAVPYKCGSGSSLDHFKVKSKTCDAAPWGGSAATCDPKHGETHWNFGGVSVVNGETEMMNALAQGNTLYVSMTLHKNFMTHKRGVYSMASGPEMGGHAMVALGWGKEASGQRYWIVQNSWGDGWCENGFVRIIRGENLGDIEKNAMYIAGWPTGAQPPNLPAEQQLAIALSRAGLPVDVNTVKAGAGAFLLVIVGLASSLYRCITAAGRKQQPYQPYSQVRPY